MLSFCQEGAIKMVLFLFAFILFPFVANAESFDCYYTATTGNKKTVVGYCSTFGQRVVNSGDLGRWLDFL